MTRGIRIAALCGIALGACSRPASAQVEPRVGVVAAFPASLGVHWQISDRFAVRPDFTYSWSEFSASSSALMINGVVVSSSESRSSSTALGSGVSVLVTVKRWQRLRADVVPRAQYTWLSSTTEQIVTATAPLPSSTSVIFGLRNIERAPSVTRRGRSYSASASFGMDYRLAERFGVFGEAGFAYSSSRQPTTISTAGTRSATLRSGIGATFWF